jgi:[ribosomal protein S5]-alanine N-acetyltransferase
MPDNVILRPLQISDAEALAEASSRNRTFLQPWEPMRPESFYTADGQRVRLADSMAEQDAGRSFFWALFDGDTVVGRISLTDVVRGAFENGNLGYWVAETHQGLGLATAAARNVCDFAVELGLHRLQAGTLVHNAGSQTVLARCGFTRIGLAENYIRINGRWQDHVLFQKILHG